MDSSQRDHDHDILESFERQNAEWRRRAARVDAVAAQQFDKLLKLAETSDSGQARRAAKFIASVFNGQGYPLDPFVLRAVDVEISDAMLVCLDALRWAGPDLYKRVPRGEERTLQVIEAWGLSPAVE